MLVLSRKVGERIVLPGSNVVLTVLSIGRGQIRLGISAPPEVAVYREELWRSKDSSKGEPTSR
ncbi:MAG TPA: carbon storage regulator [Gemmataceae bacterium]|nr:carbon storage regulator [Gemmataceae bacterium]